MKTTVLAALTGVAAGVALDVSVIGKKKRESFRKTEDSLAKQQEFYHILLQWIRVHQEGRTLADYFKKCGYKTVAIYGMKELGVALLEELENTEIKVLYAIDRDADNLYVGTDVYKPDEDLEPVDVVIVTAIHYFDAIVADMRTKVECPIISLEDVVWEV